MEITNIAKQLQNAPVADNIILIYAFNSTGKTRLSVEYKNITKQANGGNHAGVYYNAYSEDLFVWDNDEDNNNEGISLNILYSSLNKFHSFVTDKLLNEKLLNYHIKYKFLFNLNLDPEKGIDSVSFYRLDDEDEENPIKISRGEERIFV